jgi:hypothetical protein
MKAAALDPSVEWVSVQELPPTAEERRHDLLQSSIIDVVFYAITIVLTLYVVYPSGILSDPTYLAGYIGMMAGFALLFLWGNRRRARTGGRSQYFDLSRIGSSSTTLYIQDLSGTLEVPWSVASSPELTFWRGRKFYLIRYKSAGDEKLLRLTAARMAAVLQLRDRPDWVHPESLLADLEAEYRRHGVALPSTSHIKPARSP